MTLLPSQPVIVQTDKRQHLKVVQQTRELVGALSAFINTENESKAVEEVVSMSQDLAFHGSRMSLQRPLRDWEAAVTILVLKNVEESELFPGQQSALADSLLSSVRDLVFGADTGSLTLMSLVYSQSFRQALAARNCCLAMVQVLLAPENAFGMLKLATMYSLPLLQWSSLRASLADFQSAVVADIIGFCSLEVSQLLELFADDHLQVSSELEVFNAAVEWIAAHTEERSQHLCRLLEEDGVRLELMERNVLAVVDAHPLVVQSKEASSIVARAYMQCCYGHLISDGTSAPPRKRKSKLPGLHPCHASVASCSSASLAAHQELASTCRHPYRLPPCHSVEAGSQSPDVPEDSSLAMSCAKSVAAVQKRKRGALSPDNTETPELRVKRADTGDQAAQQCTPTDVLPGKASYARLPSKRRLFE